MARGRSPPPDARRAVEGEQDLTRPVAHQDVLEVAAEVGGDYLLAQRGHVAVGIAIGAGQRLRERRLCLGQRLERELVRRQLHAGFSFRVVAYESSSLKPKPRYLTLQQDGARPERDALQPS